MRGSTCFFLLDDGLFSFGNNDFGQLGIGNKENQNLPCKIDFFKDKNIEEIYCGAYTSFILTENKLYGFGSNVDGQLGIGNTEHQLTPVEITFFQDKKIQKIECGYFHTFVLADNILYAFGWNNYGQLGIGNKKNQDIPIEIPFFKDKEILEISLGGDFSLVYTKNYKLYAFGRNDTGQLGIGDLINRLIPIEVSFFNDKKIKRIQTGGYQTFISVIENNIEVLYCFGRNDFGQLGIGNFKDQLSPCKMEFKVDQNEKIEIHSSIHHTYILTNQLYSVGDLEKKYVQLHQSKLKLVEFFKDKKIKTIFRRKDISFKGIYIQFLIQRFNIYQILILNFSKMNHSNKFT